MAESQPHSTQTVPEAVQQELGKSDAEKKLIVDQITKKTAVRPTPTQKESDLAALGQPVFDKEPDGSEPEPRRKGRHGEDETKTQTRAMEATPHQQGSGYSTRSAGTTAKRESTSSQTS